MSKPTVTTIPIDGEFDATDWIPPASRDAADVLLTAVAGRRERGGCVNATFLSTFSGVGGLDLGLERAGWRCVGQAEADPYRRAVLAARFPGVPCRVFILACDVGGRAGAERAGQVLAVGHGCPGHPETGGEAGAGTADGPADGAAPTLRSHLRPGSNSDGAVVVNALTKNGVGAGGGPDDNAAQAGHLVPIAATLTRGGHPNSNTPGRRKEDDYNLASTAHGVRRLTPRECERLQGFPDDWTAPAELGGPGVYEQCAGRWRLVRGVPDGRRYAALGDAVTVPVAEWIGRRLMEAA